MFRLFLYLILTYVIYFILKFIINYIRIKNKSSYKNSETEKKPEQAHIDKSKVVDADFEEIK
jgi:hypothetical protein